MQHRFIVVQASASTLDGHVTRRHALAAFPPCQRRGIEARCTVPGARDRARKSHIREIPTMRSCEFAEPEHSRAWSLDEVKSDHLICYALIWPEEVSEGRFTFRIFLQAFEKRFQVRADFPLFVFRPGLILACNPKVGVELCAVAS
jgi:hypothetical protein